MKKNRKMLLWLLILMMAVGSTAGFVSPVTIAEAATETHYYIYLDEEEFEVSRGQYQNITQLQNSEQELLAYLKSILGSQMPDYFSMISGKVITRSSDADETDNILPSSSQPPAADGSTTQDSEFQIINGVLVSYRGSAATVTIPSTVTSIGSFAFYGKTSLKSVFVPSSVKSISSGAFYNCTSLRYVVFPKETISFGNTVFYSCKNLTNLVAPSGSKAYQYAEKNEIPVTTTKSPKLEKSHAYLLKGDSAKYILYNNINSVKWKSSKSKVVSVSAAGKIKAKKKGTATITAIANGKKYKYKVTVYNKTVDRRVNQIVKSVIKKNMSNYEKIKAVHNWLIANVKYDYPHYMAGNVPPISHTAKGALLKKVAVCDGYSQAFILIMNQLGIKSKMVVGSSEGVGHGWNVVKLGGKWYHIDVTFDDPIVNGSNANTTPRYTYFLKSSSVMKKDHTWSTGKYPKCTSTKYN